MAVDSWQEAFAANGQPAHRVYGIAFIARSGSTWLGQQLSSSGVLGDPREYFNPRAAEFSIRRSAAQRFSQYYRYIKTERQTGGLFGYRIAYPHFNRLVAEGHDEQVFPDTSQWFFLRRRDMVAQAVSHFRASRSGVFHDLAAGENKAQAPPPDYDPDQIAAHLLRTAAHEFAFAEFFRSRGIEPVELWYEDCVAMARAELLTLFTSTLNIESVPQEGKDLPAVESGPRKLADADSERLAEQFRCDRGELVAHWAQQRGLVRPPAGEPRAGESETD